MPTRSTAPRSDLGGSSSSASISSSEASLSFWPSPSKNLTPLYCGGLCDAVITAPRSSARSATAGVGRTPARTAEPPAETIPRASASSSSGPEPRVSRPTKTRPRPDQSAAALPSRSTSSGVRSRPTTPRTPSVPKYARATGTTLCGGGRCGEARGDAASALGELRSLAGLVQPGLLALHDARVAGEEAGALQRHAQLGIHVDEGARDPVPHRTGLPARAAAVHANADVVPPLEARDRERSERRLAVDRARKVLLDRAPVEPGRPVTGAQDHTGNGRLALAGPLVLRDLAHPSSSTGSGFGVCASCGCSGPA